MLSNLFAVVIPPIVREGVDGALNLLKSGEQPSYINSLPTIFRSKTGLAALAGLLILVFALLKGICMYFMRMTIIIMSRHIEYDQKNDIFQQYQKLGQTFYGKNYTGDLMNRISDDVSKVRMFTGPAIMYSLNLTCMIIMVVSLMFYVNAAITLYVLIPLPILAVTIYLVSDAMNKKSDVIQRKLSGITSFVQESFAGIHVLKSYASEKDFSKDFCKRVVGGAGAQFSSGNTCRRSNNKGTSGAAYQLLGASVCLERTKPLTAMGSIPAEVRFLPEESPPGVFCVGASFVTLKLPRDDPSLAATARLAFAFTSCPSSEPESLSGISKKCPTSSPLFPGSSSGSLCSKTPMPNASPREV